MGLTVGRAEGLPLETVWQAAENFRGIPGHKSGKGPTRGLFLSFFSRTIGGLIDWEFFPS